MSRLKNITLVLTMIAIGFASCTKMSPLKEKCNKKEMVNEKEKAPEAAALQISSEGNTSEGGSITDPDHDVDHDRDKSSKVTQ